MNKTGIFCICLSGLTLCGCVSKKIYKELEANHTAALSENKKLYDQNQELLGKADQLERVLKELEVAKSDLDLQRKNFEDLKYLFEKTKQEYEKLLSSNSSMLSESAQKSRAYAAELEAMSQLLDKKEADLREREAKVAELQGNITHIQESMNAMRDALKTALISFEGKGITISQRDGKIYVSLENKLMFASGSWAVNAQGKKAIDEIAKVLVMHPEINVVIEGHTDNVPYNGTGNLKDNWDLSVMRATSIVRQLMTNTSINAKNITAAGRSEFAPVLPNTSTDNKAKNRRIELIIMPDLSAIEKLLETTGN